MAEETKTKTVLGQAFVNGQRLVQDQIFMIILPGGKVNSSMNHVTLIEDIWEDLKGSDKYGVKHGKGDYWYWEIDVTDTETEKVTKMKVQVPRPGQMVFWNEEKKEFDLEESKEDTEWASYWKKRISDYINSPSYKENAISPVEVTFPESKYLDQNGNEIVKKEITFNRDDLGDMDNLLMMMF